VRNRPASPKAVGPLLTAEPKRRSTRIRFATRCRVAVRQAAHLASACRRACQSSHTDEASFGQSRSRSPGERPSARRSHELLSPSAHKATGSHQATGLPHPPRCALRFSQPLDALLPPLPSGLVSSRSRSWGLNLSEVFPRWTPSTSRLVVPLVTLPPKRVAFRGLSAQRIRAHTTQPVRAERRPILSQASSSPGSSPLP
jgi:hypothetical protein